ncbi:GH25 family lysozyme [Lentilactobacillus farraginis]|uniref:Lyzozyme M1 n=2 Tax=Lentilactobacillus farraginis DSM 18382 = JCM 14108 TaxID=1423743 RepID=X0PBJ6_9LACO|nr:GH25 family lysozyme [Lentilactobacillus farraginis]GAF37484.1 lyzozyme M1 [Lentilactobacillus farraginis DSM 18382 = JCM 14108]
MPKIVIDLASYQRSSVSYFKTFKAHGVDAAMVKLTEGTNYLNPKASAQVKNAYKVFGAVGAYHFFHGNGTAEARYFLAWVRKFGLDKSTVLAIDVEASGLPYNTTPQVNVFLRYLINAGYKNVITYGSGSWFNSGRIKRSELIDKHIWVAAYGVSQPGVANANSWQFTDNFKGLKVDASYDFDGSLSGSKTSAKPSYYQSKKIGLYEVTAPQLWIYKKKNFGKATKSYQALAKGSRVWAYAVKYGKITHLKLKYANGYISSNAEYIRRIYLKK